MPRRFDGLAVLLGVGSLVVLVSLFLDWYELDVSAWEAYELLDLVLAALCLAILATLVPGIRPLHGLRAAVPWLAGATFVLVLAQLLNPPPLAQDSDMELGYWLALAGSALMAIAALLAAFSFA